MAPVQSQALILSRRKTQSHVPLCLFSQCFFLRIPFAVQSASLTLKTLHFPLHAPLSRSLIGVHPLNQTNPGTQQRQEMQESPSLYNKPGQRFLMHPFSSCKGHQERSPSHVFAWMVSKVTMGTDNFPADPSVF